MPSAQEFKRKFIEFLKSDPSKEEWGKLTQSYQLDFFSDIIKILENADANVKLPLYNAFLLFSNLIPAFKFQISEYALDINELKPGEVSFQSRIILRCLIEDYRTREKDPDELLFRVLSRHRSYFEKDVPPQHRSDLGDEMRKTLLHLTKLISKGEPQDFISPFRFTLTETPKWKGSLPLEEWNERKFLEEILSQLCNKDLIQSFDWKNVPDEEEPLFLLQDTLLKTYNDSYYNQELHYKTGDAILRHLERCCQIWSLEFKGWHWNETESKGFSSERCFLAEKNFRRALEQLKRERPGIKQTGYIDNAVVALYQKWIDFAGGWRAEETDSTLKPQVYWLRDWHQMEQSMKKLDLFEAIAPYGFLRWYDRLRISGAQPPNDYLGEGYLTSIDYILELAKEVEEASKNQGILNIELPNGVETIHKTLPSTDFLFSRNSHPRTTLNTQLHSDHRLALCITMGAFLQWRADYEYRAAGPKLLLQGFNEDQLRHLTNAKLYYTEALRLLNYKNEFGSSDWIVGLGLFGTMLKIERESLINECELRIRKIRELHDYAYESMGWPIKYAWELYSEVNPIINTVKTLQTSLALKYEENSLQDEVKKQDTAVKQAQDFLNAAIEFLKAENFTLDAVSYEKDQQKIREIISGYRQKEAKWHVAALKFAQAAAGAEGNAEQKLLEAEQTQSEIIKRQIEQLQESIEKLRAQLPKLKDDIKKASEELKEFEKNAQELHKKKQSGRALVSILKKVGSLVSKYFTGVDLITIGEIAMQAVKAAQTGDLSSAALYAFEASDSLSKGKLTEFLKENLNVAEKYVSSTMADSLTKSAEVIGKATGIKGDEAVRKAAEAISRQAFKIGVSYMAEKAHLEKVIVRLGIDPKPQLVEKFHNEIKKEVPELAARIIHFQNDSVKKKIAEILDCKIDELEIRLKQKVNEASEQGKAFETYLLEVVREVHAKLPKEADPIIAELKAELLKLRDESVKKIGENVAVESSKVDKVLDELIADTIKKQQKLPPAIPLPEEVRESLRNFQENVRRANSKIGFLINPGAPDNYANQLADYEDDEQFNMQLHKVVGELSEGINEAYEHMGAAEDDLQNLLDELNQLQVDKLLQQFKEDAKKWQVEAKKNLEEYQENLWREAGESLLAAQQQVQVEVIRNKEIGKRILAQESIVRGREAQVDATQKEIDIRKLSLSQAQNQRSRWLLFHRPFSSNETRALINARLYLLNKANNLLIQAWQLLNTYQVEINKYNSSINYKPDYKVPTLGNIESGKKLLEQLEEVWNNDLLEEPRVLTTINLSELKEALAPKVFDRLGGDLSGGGILYPSLILKPQDLKRLKNGLTFRIVPLLSPEERNQLIPPTPVSTESNSLGEYIDFDRIEGWNDEGAYNIRLIGVMVAFNNPTKDMNPINLYLEQEANPWLYADAENGHKKLVVLPLQSITGLDESKQGVQLRGGQFFRKQFETRPLFGTYTLRIYDQSYKAIKNPESFSAVLHFIAIGQPG